MLLQRPIFPRHVAVHDTAFPKLQIVVPNASHRYSFPDLVRLHMEAIWNDKHISTKGSTTGLMFEMILLDALVQNGVDQNLMIDQVKHRDTNAEIDCLIARRDEVKGPPVAMMFKTSVRERYKQPDRDALLLKYHNGAWAQTCEKYGVVYTKPIDFWLVQFREKPNDPPDRSIRHMHNVGKKMRGLMHEDRALSIYDEGRMAALLKACLDV